jgi:hypothetical protein
VVLQKRRREILFQQHTRTMPIQGRGSLVTAGAAILLICLGTSFGAQSVPSKDTSKSTKGVADTSKVVVTEDYFESPEKKSALSDSSGKQLSTQQMVDFLKNELRKLKEEINTIVQKTAPDTEIDSGANDVEVMKLFIIKGKLESMEKMLDEWTKQRTLEVSAPKENSTVSPSKSSLPHGKK